MVIFASLLLVLLLGVANPLSAPFFHRSTSSLERPFRSTKNKHSDRQRGTPTALPSTDSTHSVTTG